VFGNRVERWDLLRAGLFRNEDRSPLPIVPRNLTRAQIGGGSPWQRDSAPLAVSPSGERFILGGKDQQLPAGSTTTAKADTHILLGPMSQALVFHPREPLLALGQTNTVRLLDAGNLRYRPELPLGGPAWYTVWGLAFSTDGKRLAAGFD